MADSSSRDMEFVSVKCEPESGSDDEDDSCLAHNIFSDMEFVTVKCEPEFGSEHESSLDFEDEDSKEKSHSEMVSDGRSLNMEDGRKIEAVVQRLQSFHDIVEQAPCNEILGKTSSSCSENIVKLEGMISEKELVRNSKCSKRKKDGTDGNKTVSRTKICNESTKRTKTSYGCGNDSFVGEVAAQDSSIFECSKIIVKSEMNIAEPILEIHEECVPESSVINKGRQGECAYSSNEVLLKTEDETSSRSSTSGYMEHWDTDDRAEDTRITGNEIPPTGDDVLNSTENSTSATPCDTTSCDSFNLHTTGTSSLWEHLSDNTGVKVSHCMECGKMFTKVKQLRIHMKRHLGQRDFACDFCEYRTFTYAEKKRHMAIHSDERKYVCQYCNKSFITDTRLRGHVSSVHEKPNHVCVHCGFITHRANGLRAHIDRMHGTNQVHHVCPVCGVKLKKKSAFIVHMRSHTGERPYSCSDCDRSFTCANSLTNHRSTVHGPREFTCKDCDKSFPTLNHLKRHVVIHSEVKPFQCTICQYSSNIKGNLDKHVARVHNKDQNLAGKDIKVKSEWIEKGQKLTEEYLENLSSKLGRKITLSELKEHDAKKSKKSKKRKR